MTARPVRIFISYAHADREVVEQLRDHLGGLENDQRIEVFDDRQLVAGEDWDARLKDELGKAELIIFVVTAKFLRSAYCARVELKEAIRRREAEGIVVLPVIAETCLWTALPLARLQALPKDDYLQLKPLNKWGAYSDVALTQIAEQVRENVYRLASAASDHRQAISGTTPDPIASTDQPSASGRSSHPSGYDVTGSTPAEPSQPNIGLGGAGPVRAFLSYAHEDFVWRDHVLKQLGWLRKSGQLDVFFDPLIAAGENWGRRIAAELQNAEVVIVLVSANFLNSDYCIESELRPSLELHKRRRCALVIILCEHVDLVDTPFGALQCLPKDPDTNELKPLKDWGDRIDRALAPVTGTIRGLIRTLRPAPTGLPGNLFSLVQDQGVISGSHFPFSMSAQSPSAAIHTDISISSFSATTDDRIASQLSDLENKRLRAQCAYLEHLVKIQEEELEVRRKLFHDDIDKGRN